MIVLLVGGGQLSVVVYKKEQYIKLGNNLEYMDRIRKL